jgi:hypothetical protein
MALTYSKYLHISHRTLVAKGVYNGALDQDYKLHVDPLLLKTCNVPEFERAYDEFIGYFNRFVTLAPFVKSHTLSDRFYKQMYEYFRFPELANTGLGYSEGSTQGRGINGDLSLQLVDSAIEIINAGFKDPAVFALLPLFEENIGADRISDMTIAILYERFIKYTHRIAKELQVKTFGFKYNGVLYGLPAYKRRPIVFIPVSIITDLPIARDYDDIDRVCNYNRQLKARIAKQIGLSWDQYSRMKKSQWKELFLSHPSLFHEAIETYKHLVGVPYDFNSDFKDKYFFARLAQVVEDQPLELLAFLTDSPTCIFDIIRAILIQFKSLVENNYMWKVFHRKGRTPDETDWQLYLYSIADTYIKAANVDIDLTRENNSGVGAIDFKFAKGRKGKTIVEIKRASNENLLHGYVSQLPTYMQAESAEFGLFMIIREDEKCDAAIQSVFDRKAQMEKEGAINLPEIIVVDASPKASASKS